MFVINATVAALFRRVADQSNCPTILYDEVDTLFGPRAKEHEELRALLNADHRRGGKVPRCVGEGTAIKVVEFPVYAAVALAGIGDLPDTIMSRSIIIAMRRRAPHEHIEPFRQRQAETEGAPLRERLAAWAVAQAQALQAIPVMPPEITDRAADTWEALLAVADAAGGD